MDLLWSPSHRREVKPSPREESLVSRRRTPRSGSSPFPILTLFTFRLRSFLSGPYRRSSNLDSNISSLPTRRLVPRVDSTHT